MSIGPRQIPRIGENYKPTTRKIKKEESSDVLDFFPWLFIFRGWF